MSSVYLALTLVTVFGAFLFLAIAVNVSVSESRRGAEVLRAQVGPATVSLREQELSRSFVERALSPLLSGLAAVARKLTPPGARDRVAQKLVLAGSPAGWDAERVMAFKGVGLLVGGACGYLVADLQDYSGVMRVGSVGVLATIFFLIPGATLAQAVLRRQEAIRRALPDTMDLLTISVEAGLGFDAALLNVSRKVRGPLSQEIGRMLHEMQLGVTRVDAFRHLSERTTVDEVKGFVLAMIQADVFGVSIAKVLRAQARELRTRRRQRAEERAMKTPVKLLFPMIFCILPALLVVIAGPGVIRIGRVLFGPGGFL